MTLAMTYDERAKDFGAGDLEGSTEMSGRIAVHALAGIVFVGLGTARAQESNPRPAVVEAKDTLTSTGVVPTRNDASSQKNDVSDLSVPFRLTCVDGMNGDVGVTIAIASSIHVADPIDDIEARQNSTKPVQDASDSRHAKTGTLRRWFAAGATRMLGFLMGGMFYPGGRGPS